MKLIIQRVIEAEVVVNNKTIGKIGNGLLVFFAVSDKDVEEDIQWIVNKLINLRIFNDEYNKMNLSVSDIKGEILVVPNFTLYADCQKGYRPSFTKAAKPEFSKPLFDKFVNYLKSISEINIESGEFGADMKVFLINNGPVTIELER